jgi:thiol:disulfide interchange protein DsbC
MSANPARTRPPGFLTERVGRSAPRGEAAASLAGLCAALVGLAVLTLCAVSSGLAVAADRPAARAGAQPVPAPLGPTESALKRTVEERMPGVRVLGVVKTPYAGLYEVRTEDNEIFYTDDKAGFIFVGAIRDGRDPQRNLTEERQQALSAISFSELPFEGAFKIVRGNGRRQLAYFTDPNCPYCKQLEKELTQLDDVTISVFLYPILSADSLPKSRSIWCSGDRSKVWLDWMLGGVAPATAAICDSQAIDRNLAFGRRIRVTSVPTLIYPNGTRSAGMRPVAAIARAIDEAGSRKP